MRKIIGKTKHDDQALKFEIISYKNGALCEQLSVNIAKFDLYIEEDEYVAADIFMNHMVAGNCSRFFENNKNNNCYMEYKLYFANSQTYYYGMGITVGMCLEKVKSDGCIMFRAVTHVTNTKLMRNGIANDNLDRIPLEQAADFIDGGELENIVEECIDWQSQNLPKGLSPIEQMRLKASNMFNKSDVVRPQATNVPKEATNEDTIFNPETLKITPGSKNYKEDLEKIIGLDDVKTEFEKMVITHRFQQERAERMGTTAKQNNMHMCFLGAPGTGKTTIARVVAGYLYDNGILKNNECIEISGLDMVANYTGQTSEKTRIIIERAKGGVLFIDEAYAIADDGFGKEAISVLLKSLEDDRGEFVVIFAGYERDMSRFLDMNEGFKSRINRYFHFENYKVNELARIFMRIINSKNLIITEDALTEVLKIFAKECEAPGFSNGRYVRNFVEKLENKHIFNVRNRTDNKNLNLITVQDV